MSGTTKPNTKYEWVHRQERRRTRIERRPAADVNPRIHGTTSAIGTLVAIDAETLHCAKKASSATALRTRMEMVEKGGGRAYVLMSRKKREYRLSVRRLTATGADGPAGTLRGAILITAAEKRAAGDGLDQQVDADTTQLENWLNGHVYYIALDRLHRCAECTNGHWAEEYHGETIIGLGATVEILRERFEIDVTDDTVWQPTTEGTP